MRTSVCILGCVSLLCAVAVTWAFEAPVGVRVDYVPCDGTYDLMYLGAGIWNPNPDGPPAPGSLIELAGDGDDVADGELVDTDGDGLIDSYDLGFNGVDGSIGNVESGPPGTGLIPLGLRLDFYEEPDGPDGEPDAIYLGGNVWDPHVAIFMPGTYIILPSIDEDPDGVLLDTNGDGLSDAIDMGFDGVIDYTF